MGIAVPEPLDVRPIEWMVVTPANAEEVFRSLQAKGDTVVLFAMTDDGYKSLSLSWAEVRNLVANQRSIIVKYKDYYETQDNRSTSNGKK